MSYFYVSTLSRILPQDHDSAPAATRTELAEIRRHFFSTPLLNISVPSFPVANVFRVSNISHCLQQGWGKVTLFRIMIVSSTHQCRKFGHRLRILLSLPENPSTGQSIAMSVRGKATRYSFGVGVGNGGGKVMYRPDRPCFVWR